MVGRYGLFKLQICVRSTRENECIWELLLFPFSRHQLSLGDLCCQSSHHHPVSAIKMVIHLVKQKSLSPLPKLDPSSAFPISVNGTAVYTVMPGSHHPHMQPLATLFKINQAVICLLSSSCNASVSALISFRRMVDTISWTHRFLSLLETWVLVTYLDSQALLLGSDSTGLVWALGSTCFTMIPISSAEQWAALVPSWFPCLKGALRSI